MRVLHAIPGMSPEWTGSASSVAGLATALTQNGVCSEIVTTVGRSARAEAELLPTPRVAVHSFNTQFPARFWAAYSRPLARFLDGAAASFDLVHIHTLYHYPAFAASRAASKHDVPIVVSPRGGLNERALRHKQWKKWGYRRLVIDGILRSAAALHAVAHGEQAQIARLGYSKPVFVSPNGISRQQVDELNSFHGSRPLAAHPCLNGKRVILFLGRIQSQKGLDTLARSFATVAPDFEDAALLVVGPDEDGTRSKVEDTLRAAGVLDRVAFAGMLTGRDKLAAFACADLFVLPSYSEGFSNAVVEALAAGLPVIVSEQCNFPEVAKAKAGLVVPAQDAAVATAIRVLLSNADLREQMGRNGRRLILERYTWPSVAASMSDFYRTLIRRRA